MSNELPSLQMPIQSPVQMAAQAPVQLPMQAGHPAGASDVRRFLAELESVAESCQTVVTRSSSSDRPQTYLEPIAEKYSFARPRSNPYQYKQQPKALTPTGLFDQIKRATKSLIDSFSHPHRKP